MNALGSYLFHDIIIKNKMKIYSMIWLIKPKKYKNNQYYADNHLGEHSKRQYYWMRNNKQYEHTLSNGRRF
jgi:hypothetical protein